MVVVYFTVFGIFRCRERCLLFLIRTHGGGISEARHDAIDFRFNCLLTTICCSNAMMIFMRYPFDFHVSQLFGWVDLIPAM